MSDVAAVLCWKCRNRYVPIDELDEDGKPSACGECVMKEIKIRRRAESMKMGRKR